jgi:tRNA/tmRNA/rRNA uracil-C5-methylase (TrmA/RlmC/RlmD family)
MTLTYETEARLKAEAATLFWSSVTGNVPLAPLITSPRGRAYRTVSKRKAFKVQGRLRLRLIGPAENPRPAGITVGRCAIEPDIHAALYQAIETNLHEHPALPLADCLQYAVIKGTYDEQTILFNVRAITPACVRAVNHVSRSLTGRFGKSVAGVFLFEGEPEGRYYLSPRDPGGAAAARKVFGKNLIFTRIGEVPFLYPPMAFSQVNGSILESFVAGARTLLSPAGTDTLFDLYCGYGLFGLSLAPLVRRIIGAESSHLAVAAATANARRHNVRHARFVRTVLNAESARAVTARSPAGSLMLLDPPRSGTASGVIETLAGRFPRRVVHVFCNMEILRGELDRWETAGYLPERCIPFDMFPGTPELELMVLLSPARRAGEDPPYSAGIRSKGTSSTRKLRQSR